MPFLVLNLAIVKCVTSPIKVREIKVVVAKGKELLLCEKGIALAEQSCEFLAQIVTGELILAEKRNTD